MAAKEQGKSVRKRRRSRSETDYETYQPTKRRKYTSPPPYWKEFHNELLFALYVEAPSPYGKRDKPKLEKYDKGCKYCKVRFCPCWHDDLCVSCYGRIKKCVFTIYLNQKFKGY